MTSVPKYKRLILIKPFQNFDQINFWWFTLINLYVYYYLNSRVNKPSQKRPCAEEDRSSNCEFTHSPMSKAYICLAWKSVATAMCFTKGCTTNIHPPEASCPPFSFSQSNYSIIWLNYNANQNFHFQKRKGKRNSQSLLPTFWIGV